MKLWTLSIILILLRTKSTHRASNSSVICINASERISSQGIDFLRYILFSKMVNKSNVKLESLPPTSETARQHVFRVYLIVQKWNGVNLDPCMWGWKVVSDEYIPVENEKAPAPPEILQNLFCRCKNGCSTACGCRKIG